MAARKNFLIQWNDQEYVLRAHEDWWNVPCTHDRNKATRYTKERAQELVTKWNGKYKQDYPEQDAPYFMRPLVQYENDRIGVRKASKHHQYCNADAGSENFSRDDHHEPYYEIEVNSRVTVLCGECLHALWELVGIELGEL